MKLRSRLIPEPSGFAHRGKAVEKAARLDLEASPHVCPSCHEGLLMDVRVRLDTGPDDFGMALGSTRERFRSIMIYEI